MPLLGSWYGTSAPHTLRACSWANMHKRSCCETAPQGLKGHGHSAHRRRVPRCNIKESAVAAPECTGPSLKPSEVSRCVQRAAVTLGVQREQGSGGLQPLPSVKRLEERNLDTARERMEEDGYLHMPIGKGTTRRRKKRLALSSQPSIPTPTAKPGRRVPTSPRHS